MPLSNKEVAYVCVYVSVFVPVCLAIILHVINCCIRLFAAAADARAAPDPTANGHAEDSVVVDVVRLQRKLIKEIRRLKLQEMIPLDIVKENDSSTGQESSECAICLKEFEPGEEVRVLPGCGHRYHRACIDEWLLDYNSKQCPTCRAIVCPIAEISV